MILVIVFDQEKTWKDIRRDRVIRRVNLNAHQDRHFFLLQNIISTKDAPYYKITDDPTIQSVWLVVIFAFAFLYEKKNEEKTNMPKTSKKNRHYIPYHSRWHDEFDVIVHITMQTKRNCFFISLFVFRFFYSRCFRNHHNLFYKFDSNGCFFLLLWSVLIW